MMRFHSAAKQRYQERDPRRPSGLSIPSLLLKAVLLPAITVVCLYAHAQEPKQDAKPPAPPVASVSTEGVTLHGISSVEKGLAQIANNGDVTAGDKTAHITLARGGTLLVCASTTIHIARDAVANAGARPNDAGLMFSVDRGAFEANYAPGSYSDVILTPDLRLLVSPPGHANLKLNVNRQGDTCVDNPGDDAPYLTVNSLAESGVYRVRPNQRVLFVKGSLREVVDNEHEPCGCPAAAPPEALATNGPAPGGPSSKPSDTAFPTAISEGLQPPPALPSTPIVPAGQPHAQVSATLSSNTPPGPPPPEPPPQSPTAPNPAPAPLAAKKPQTGFFHSIGHLFSKVFGADTGK